MKSHEIAELISNLACKIDGVPLIFGKGVPHIVVNIGSMDYSVCYFAKHNSFRIFWPYMQFDKPQDKQDFQTEQGVIEFFKERINK